MLLDILAADRALVVVRAPCIKDPGGLCEALVAGGMRAIEFTFTTPGVEEIIRAAVQAVGQTAVVGAGTVTDAARAEAAIDAGAQFLVTPGLDEQVAAIAKRAHIPVLLGAFTPTEVMRAIQLGAAAVKIFPAGALAPRYIGDLKGPFPDVSFVPSGGLNADNAAAWIAAGALAVTAGSSVVPARDIEVGDWKGITARAREFVRAAASGASGAENLP